MADMLVRLYNLPEVDDRLEALEEDGIVVKRAQPWERSPLRRFIEDHQLRPANERPRQE